MAVRYFDPKTGKYLGGGQSYDPIKEAFTPKPSGTGGGGSPKPTPSAPSGGGIDYEAQARAEVQAKEQERLRIETERAKLVNQARQDYLKAVQRGSSRNERTNALNQLNQRIAQADIQAQSGRESAGISKVTRTPTRTNVQVISGGRETAVAEMLRKEYGETSYGGTESYSEILPGTTGVSNKNISVNKIKEYYNKANEFLASKLTRPAFSIFERAGLPLTDVRTQALGQPSWLGIGSFGIRPPPEQDIIAGFSAGALEDIKEKPAKQILLYGTGAGLGFAVGGAVAGASKLSSGFGGAVKGTTTIVGGVLGGLYSIDVAEKSYKASRDIYGNPTIAESGKVLGIGAKDIFLFGKGYQRGEKGFEQVRGVIKTRGRKYIEIPQGEYPQAPTGEQLSLFRKNIYSELGEKPGAFHTTSEIFWKEGKITPKEGTSELPGLYGSTQISTPFSRIPGSSSTQKFNPTTWLKNLFTPSGEPGVAYLQPKGFRYSKAEKVMPYKVGEQTFNWGFEKPSKLGYADVPGIKTELEVVFRPKAGEYALTGKKYYTNIFGVRVPIDSFKYAGETGTGTENIFFNPSAYNLPKISSSISAPTSIVSLVSASEIPLESGLSKLKNKISEVSSSSDIFISSVPSSLVPSSSVPKSSYKGGYSGSSAKPSSYVPPSSPPPSSVTLFSSYIPPSSKSSYRPPSSVSSSYRPPSSSSLSYKPLIPSSLFFKAKNLAKEIMGEGYKTYFIKAGKKQYLPGISPKGRATEKGAKYVMGNLRATFGIEKAGVTTEQDIFYQIQKDIFRGYKIKGAKREALKDMWIQKAGTKKEDFTIKGARLRSGGERTEILSYLKSKRKPVKNNWLGEVKEIQRSKKKKSKRKKKLNWW